MNKFIAEFLGTLALVYVILATGQPIAIGLTLALIIMVIGGISGGHVNPAVSFAMYLGGKLSQDDLMPYVIAQLSGAVVALELHKRM
jgi:aquaporin Z|tara:strand:- start:234 stop:494 length:261 start_codon:yes stop_codon:yes gene_type:complete